MFKNLGEVLNALEVGIDVLATDPGRIRERLIAAFHKELHMIRPEDIAGPDLSADAQPCWREVVAAVTARHEDERGSYEPSIQAMTEDEACHIAGRITAVASMISFALEQD